MSKAEKINCDRECISLTVSSFQNVPSEAYKWHHTHIRFPLYGINILFPLLWPYLLYKSVSQAEQLTRVFPIKYLI